LLAVALLQLTIDLRHSGCFAKMSGESATAH